MYFLVLAATLALSDYAPRFISPHDTYEDCAKAAQDANKDDRLKTADARSIGMKFVCLKLVPDA
jgi:hypothetical protein